MKTLISLVSLLFALHAYAAEYEHRNFSGADRLPVFQDGDVFRWCNFGQVEPHTQIGYTVVEGTDPPQYRLAQKLTFEHCNLNNCDLPPDAVVKDSLVVHRAWIAVVTISAADYEKRQEEEEAAMWAAEEATLAQPVVATAKTTRADVIKQFEDAKATAVDAAMTALNAERESKEEPVTTGLTPRQNPDGTWTYYRLEVVK